MVFEYILMTFFVMNGMQVRQEITMPDYETCVAQKQIWLAEAKRLWVKSPEAYCVVRSK